jgi:7-keto-8-aminopelargonate synthetase-like enzyme
MHRFEHNNPDDLDARLKRTPLSRCRLVVTESVFSMDGDVAPVREIAAVARRHDAVLMVDEAHATGIFGPRGAGVVALEGAEQDVHIRMGTLSKALGSQGGFVCGSVPLRDLLVNRARSFVYSTGLPPPAVGAALASLDWIDANPGAGVELLTRAGVFRKRLVEAGINTGNSGSQIVPVIVGDEVRAMSMSERLLKDGFLVPAVRPPTVPAGTARLRFSVTLAHSSSDLERTAEAVIRCARDGGTC